MIQINEEFGVRALKCSTVIARAVAIAFMAGLLTGCEAWISQVPIAPFQSETAPPTELPKDSSGMEQGSGNERGAIARSERPESYKSSIGNSAAGSVAPKASLFLIKWSLPASSVSINEFKLDFGENPKALNNSVKLKRSDLESTYSVNNTELIFQHKVSVPGAIESLSVKVSAISTSGQITESNVFTSKRLVDSAT